ncbi:uncharacterized protein LOC106163931, partial [Lingula anatina]|uniref:Uncharacterized protein LOC106163931 n=1 Tax=Lingula anatina TaxID=7574 RepID=A0A1S3IHY4_LINAN
MLFGYIFYQLLIGQNSEKFRAKEKENFRNACMMQYSWAVLLLFGMLFTQTACHSRGTFCKNTVLGWDYVGHMNVTRGGFRCQNWTSQTPNRHSFVVSNFPDATLEDAWNFCRNPDNDTGGPWCFIDDDRADDSWESCAIPICGDTYWHGNDCKTSHMGLDYQGTRSLSRELFTCQRWDSQTPNSHYLSADDFPDASLSAAENYCRNPDHDTGGPWCYLNSTDHYTWDYCDIPFCRIEANNNTTQTMHKWCKAKNETHEWMCIDYHSDATTWNLAKKNCTDGGGNLAHIPNRFTQMGIQTLLAFHNSTRVWTAFKAYNSNGLRFKWAGRNFPLGNYTNFIHVINRTGCGLLRADSNYTWDITNCNENNPFLCEMSDARPIDDGSLGFENGPFAGNDYGDSVIMNGSLAGNGSSGFYPGDYNGESGMMNGTFAGNDSSGFYPGGDYNGESGIMNGTFAGNDSSGFYPGGDYNGESGIMNGTFAGNDSSGFYPGGDYNGESGIMNGTLAGNDSSGFYPGGDYNGESGIMNGTFARNDSSGFYPGADYNGESGIMNGTFVGNDSSGFYPGGDFNGSSGHVDSGNGPTGINGGDVMYLLPTLLENGRAVCYDDIGKCYGLLPYNLSYDQASGLCSVHGATMAVLQEYQLVKNISTLIAYNGETMAWVESSALSWSAWFDRDNPSGSGDVETLSGQNELGPVCPSGSPISAQCRVKRSGAIFTTTSGSPPNVLSHRCTPTEGLVCKNSDQSGSGCRDYEIRYLCPKPSALETEGPPTNDSTTSQLA